MMHPSQWPGPRRAGRLRLEPDRAFGWTAKGIVLRKKAVRRATPPRLRTPWHHALMVTLVRIAGCLIEDAFRWMMLRFRSTQAVLAENLFLRHQLALSWSAA